MLEALPWTANAASKVNTARIAPIGSISVPSASSKDPTRGSRPIERTMGPMTVGPVTTSTAESSAASCQSTPRITRAAINVPTSVRVAPTVKSSPMAPPAPRTRAAEPERALEQDHSHRDRDAREQQVTENLVGVERARHRPRHEPAEKQQHHGGDAEPPRDPLRGYPCGEHAGDDNDGLFVHRGFGPVLFSWMVWGSRRRDAGRRRRQDPPDGRWHNATPVQPWNSFVVGPGDGRRTLNLDRSRRGVSTSGAR